MRITIVGRKCSPGEDFKQRAEKKLAKIQRFFGEDAEAKITVSTQRYLHIVEITVVYDAMYFRAESSAADLIESLDNCVDVLVNQIRKNKTKLEKRLRKDAFEGGFDKSVEEEVEFKVVRTKRIPVKPLPVDDAILEMNMLGHQFYMFLNEDTNRVNVVYRRKSGDYGLLEPDMF